MEELSDDYDDENFDLARTLSLQEYYEDKRIKRNRETDDDLEVVFVEKKPKKAPVVELEESQYHHHDQDLDYAIALSLQEEEEVSPDDKLSDGMAALKDESWDPKSIVHPRWELEDPHPDIHKLFVQFDVMFFNSKLTSAGVAVQWGTRMTLCAGVCCYEGRGGLCSIRLSEPLLKLRPRKDLVETLLHEMIHALLFVTANKRDRDSHGPEFLSHMHRINKLTGANITVYHSFHDEVSLYRQHWWKCNGSCRNKPPFYGTVRRAVNRAPSRHDPWWAEHQHTCGGTFIKIKEPEGYSNKKRTSKPKRTTPTKDIVSLLNKSPAKRTTVNKVSTDNVSRDDVEKKRNNMLKAAEKRMKSPNKVISKTSESHNDIRDFMTHPSTSDSAPKKLRSVDSTPKPSPRSAIVLDSTPKSSPRSAIVIDSASNRSSPRSAIVLDSASKSSPRRAIVLDSTPKPSPRSAIVIDSTSNRSSPSDTISVPNKSCSNVTIVIDSTPNKSIPSDTIVLDPAPSNLSLQTTGTSHTTSSGSGEKRTCPLCGRDDIPLATINFHMAFCWEEMELAESDSDSLT